MAEQHKTALDRAREIAEYWNTQRVDTPWLVRAIHTAIIEATNEVTLRAQAQENELNQAHCEKLLLRNECARLRDLAQELLQFIEDVHGEAPPHIQQLVDAVFPPDEGTARQHAALRAQAVTPPEPEGSGPPCQQCGTLREIAKSINAENMRLRGLLREAVFFPPGPAGEDAA